jgi:hypothetical protein
VAGSRFPGFKWITLATYAACRIKSYVSCVVRGSRVEDRSATSTTAEYGSSVLCDDSARRSNQAFELEKRSRALTVKTSTEYCAVRKEKLGGNALDVPVRLEHCCVSFSIGYVLNSLRPKNLTLKMSVAIQYMNMPFETQYVTSIYSTVSIAHNNQILL